MSSLPMPKSEPMADDLYPLPPEDLTRALERHLAAAFSPDLAFDLVLNDLVARAAEATGASTAALALVRDGEMFCRAATGPLGPGLGDPLSTRDGLSGACVRGRAAQVCNDTESDPRVDPATAGKLGVRSMLIVPVFGGTSEEATDRNSRGELIGVLEVLSAEPHAFSEASQTVLEGFAREASNVRHTADQVRDQVLAATAEPPETGLLRSFDTTPGKIAIVAPAEGQPYEAWTLILGGLVILAAIGVSFMVGSRVGWLRSPQIRPIAPVSEPAPLQAAAPAVSPPAPVAEAQHPKPTKAKAKAPIAGAESAPPAASGDLVVYDKGKVIFRLKGPGAASADSSKGASAQGATSPTPPASPVVAASSNTRLTSQRSVWLAPEEAESRLLSHVEPKYPPDALAERRSGSVVLDVNVGEDGAVSSVRTRLGDPILGAAAAQAVRTWHYRPYRWHEKASSFETDVTVIFSLPN